MLKEEQPTLFAQVKKWISIKEYIIWRLTGKILTDTTMAAGSGMMNLKTLTWDEKILAQIGLDQAQLPTIADQQSTVGKIIPEYRAKLGLNDETQSFWAQAMGICQRLVSAFWMRKILH